MTESKLRKEAAKLGLRLQKGFLRYTTGAIAPERERGYSLIDIRNNCYVAGCNQVYINTMSIDDVCEYLESIQ